MTILADFLRVSRTHPCPVCGKPDWCLVSREGGDDPVSALCRRVEADHHWGDAGWFHQLRDSDRRPRRRPRAFKIRDRGRDFAEEAREYTANCTSRRRASLAASLGVLGESLARLGLGWDDRAFTFPMQDGLGAVRGIRRRFPNGRQCAVKGSKNGLFVPTGLHHTGLLLVCEGASDTAALLDLGYDTIGRPSCTGGAKLVVKFIRARQPEHVVVVTDNDRPGRRGAGRLAAQLRVVCPSVRILEPGRGAKDARAWVDAGATAAEVQAAVAAAEPLHLKVKVRRRARA